MFRKWRLSAWLLVLSIGAQSAVQAWHADGCIVCDQNQNGMIDPVDPPLVGVTVMVENTAGTFSASGVSDAGGCFLIELPDLQDSYRMYMDPTSLPAGTIILTPAGGVYEFNTNVAFTFSGNFQATTPDCLTTTSECWMTGGGVKFETVTRTFNAVSKGSNKGGGPADTVGGNIYPSCSQFPGNGGNWNHVAHSIKLHLLGKNNTVIRCGNVEGHPPGTDSPVCSVNFIEWRGTGVVQGVGGSKFGPVDVTYFGRVEDRNEPGNENALLPDGGANVDRYFLRVADTSGALLILVDSDGYDNGAVDPLSITGGNFQIHCTSCADGGGASADVDLDLTASNYFLRGDSNTDGDVDVSDAVFTLGYLFSGSTAPICRDAADANDDGSLDLSDPILGLSFLYLGSAPPPSPYPTAGGDATLDALPCAMHTASD